jgi:hypothetical protein
MVFMKPIMAAKMDKFRSNLNLEADWDWVGVLTYVGGYALEGWLGVFLVL